MKALLAAALLGVMFGVPAIAQPDARSGQSGVSCNVSNGHVAKTDGSRSTGCGVRNITPPGQRWQDGYASEPGTVDEFGRDPDPAVRLQLRRERDSWSH